MNLNLTKVEQDALATLKKTWKTAGLDFKAEVAWLSKAEMGLIASHPWIYTAGVFALGIVVKWIF